MAQLPALIETLSHFHPQSQEAIRHAAKTLRRADLLTLGTGGRGAAPMTVKDAVTLLLALNLTESPSGYVDAATAGLALRESPDLGLHQEDQRLGPGDPKKMAPAIVADVLAERTFGSALAVLVSRANELALPRYANHRAWQPDGAVKRQPVLDVEIIHVSNGFQARVMFRWLDGRTRQEASGYFAPAGTNVSPPIGRWRSIRFDEAIFWALRRTIADDPPWVFPT